MENVATSGMESQMAAPGENNTSDQPPSFEESLADLQRIVGELESGALGLEQSLGRFEQGISLLRNCYRILEAAEQRIEILTGTDAAGNPTFAPFDATATAKQQGQSAGRRPRRKASPPSPASPPQPPPIADEVSSQTELVVGIDVERSAARDAATPLSVDQEKVDPESGPELPHPRLF